MKKEELVALGISEETAAKVLEINGKDIEHAKGVVTTAKDKTIADLTTERDDFKTRLTTAETTLKGFEGELFCSFLPVKRIPRGKIIFLLYNSSL